MISARKWTLLICLVFGLQLVTAQFPMFPMFPGPIPVGLPIPLGGVGIPIPPIRLPKDNDSWGKRRDKSTNKPKTSTTTKRTTSSEEDSDELLPLPPPKPLPGFPMPMPLAVLPMPMPVPIHVPMHAPLPPPPPPPPRPPRTRRPPRDRSLESCERPRKPCRPPCRPACPPCQCMPSCTPAFFAYCSPCHQMCKCRRNSSLRTNQRPENGMLPNPVVMPPSHMVAAPFPSNYPMDSNMEKQIRRAFSDESSNYYSSSEYSYPVKRSRGRNSRHSRNHRRFSRRNVEVSEENEIGESDFVRPVLSYISQDGDIKIEKRITKDEAAQLLGDKSFQTVNILVGEDSDNKSRIIVRSNDEQKVVHSAHRRQVVLRRGGSRHVLGEGKKELVFRPPQDKKISNLTVSFQIT